MAPGFFLVLEGPEAAGKSTLARELVRRFEQIGESPLLVREPGGTPVAEALRHELLDAAREWTPESELLYMTTARADLVTRVIRPALAAGRTVLSDRYDLSTVAYQGAGRALPLDHVRWVNAAATGGLVPDLTLVLDVDAHKARERQQTSGKSRDRMERESPEFHARVAAAYRGAEGPGIRHLDADASFGDVADAAWQQVLLARQAR